MRFEFWCTGSLSAESLALYENAKATIRPSRYTIDLKLGADVLEQCKLTKDRSLIDTFDRHYLKAEPEPAEGEDDIWQNDDDLDDSDDWADDEDDVWP